MGKRRACAVPTIFNHRNFVMVGTLRFAHPTSATFNPSLRANGSRECAPDDRLREAIHGATRTAPWIASSLRSSQ